MFDDIIVHAEIKGQFSIFLIWVYTIFWDWPYNLIIDYHF